MVRVAIIGTSDQAYGLSLLFKNNNSESSGNYLEVTKPNLKKGGVLHDTGVPLANFDEALSCADIVVLAIPACALKTFVSDHIFRLKDKIIVDATNSSTRGEDLHSILATTNVCWVKAFNDIEVVDMLSNKPFFKTKIPSKMCSRYPEAAATVKAFAETSLGLDVKVVPFKRYFQIAQHQDSLGEEWLQAAWIMAILFIVTEVYVVMR
jgi:predicted dinucleotide-binding enzyme